MTASIGVFLARVHNKTGQHEKAFSTLKQVLQWIKSGIETKQISFYPLFEAYHELGHTYEALELFQEARRSFEDALSLARDVQSAGDEQTIISDLIDLHLDTGEVTCALELGEQAIVETDVSKSAPFAFLAAVSYNMGRAYAASEEWELSIDRTRAAYTYHKWDQAASSPSHGKKAQDASAFIGRILVNIGTSYSGLGNAARTTDFMAATIAHWRMGEAYLARAGAPDVEVPRRNLALTQQHFSSRTACQALLRASEPLFQSLRTELEGTTLAEERERSIAKGKHALLRKQYAEASEQFMQALQHDPLDLSPARHWHAYTRLFTCHWLRDLVEIAECFEMDSQGVRDVAMTSLLFAEWCKMAQHPTVHAYLAATRAALKLTPSEDPVERLEKLAQKHTNRPEALIYTAMMHYLRGNHEKCLNLLAGNVLDTPRLTWCRAFWQAMTFATYEQEKARTLIEEALTKGMPPTLLGPLRWLKANDETTTSFFRLVVRPLFIHDSLPYGEERAYHTDEDSTLPSRVRKIKAIRKGLIFSQPTPNDREYQDSHVLQLTGVRGPGGEARLVYVEFDGVETERGETELWPTTFALRYRTESGEVAEQWQDYWINYVPGREQVRLVDRDFQKRSLSLGPVGWDYERGSWTRGGRYWADPGSGLQIEELGTPTRYDRLPRGTLAYLQKLLEEAIPQLEIFCDACSKQTKRIGNVWCQHIFWCEKCQQISSPLERSRKMIGQSARYCTHRFPNAAGKDIL